MAKRVPLDDVEVVVQQTRMLQKRVLASAGVVASDAWLRSYWRAHPHKLMDFVASRVPVQIAGTGDGGEHVVRVVHSLPRTALDGPEPMPAIDVTPRQVVDG